MKILLSSLFLFFGISFFVNANPIIENTSYQGKDAQVIKKLATTCADKAAVLTFAYLDAGFSWEDATTIGDASFILCSRSGGDTSVYIHN